MFDPVIILLVLPHSFFLLEDHLAREGPLKGVVLFILFMDNSLGLDSYNR